MKNYYKYDVNNGKILSISYSSHEQSNISVNEGQVIVTILPNTLIDIQNQYYNLETNMLTIRPDIECLEKYTVTTTENIIISNLPNPTKVLLDEQEIYTITDGTLELTIPISGTYNLILVPEFPYFEKNISVEVL